MFQFRPNTLDEYIFKQVVGGNEYRLPRALQADARIVDIGAHIGSFSYACWLRGARHITAIEADEANYHAARQNLADTSVDVRRMAVWRSDPEWTGVSVRHTGHTQTGEWSNTGGGNVLWADGAQFEVPTVSLDTVLTDWLQSKPVRLLKIDAETSEFPILLTATRLDLIHEIVGEFHEVGGQYNDNYIPDHAKVPGIDAFTIDILQECLDSQGFYTQYTRFPGSNMGHFRSTRH